MSVCLLHSLPVSQFHDVSLYPQASRCWKSEKGILPLPKLKYVLILGTELSVGSIEMNRPSSCLKELMVRKARQIRGPGMSTHVKGDLRGPHRMLGKDWRGVTGKAAQRTPLNQVLKDKVIVTHQTVWTTLAKAQRYQLRGSFGG